MAGVVLETLSNRKLIALAVTLLVIQIVFFLIGGLIAPQPSNVQTVIGTKCLDLGHHMHKKSWFWARGSGACESVEKLSDPRIQAEGITADEIVFTFQVPLPRGGQELDMSRWFQNIVSVLQPEILYDPAHLQDNGTTMIMDVRLGYRNKGDPMKDWKEIARSHEERKLKCTITKAEKGYPLDCEILPLFELGSCFHDFYLVNLRLPTHKHHTPLNTGIGPLQDIQITFISQNGGFTKVWFSIKTAMFPTIIAILIWFWRRVTMLERPTNLLERTLFALGLALSFLNLPIEWLSLAVDMPFMLLLSDIRQGVFYATLLSFWIIFAGEHMMDQIERNRLVLYWKHLGAVVFGCVCLFVFEMCESNLPPQLYSLLGAYIFVMLIVILIRGVQLTNPFYSIWVTDVGTNLALGFIILAGIAACVYFIFLCYMFFRVFRNISSKKSALPQMSQRRRKFYTGLIYRFKFMILATLVCAALTVIFFIIGQVSEGHWKWGEEENTLQYASAFFTGVYGMWNIYVFCLMILYAPSHKFISTDGMEEDSGETIEFTQIPAETSALTQFTSKAAAD